MYVVRPDLAHNRIDTKLNTMEKVYQVCEKENRFFIFKGEKEHRTMIQSTISSSDKGLVEAIVRKMNEGKPNLVNLYLCKFEKQGLVDIIKDLSINDRCLSNLSLELPDFLVGLKEIQLRKIVNVYSECGDVELAIQIGTIDEEDFDWFGAGMAASSGICMDPAEDLADMIIEDLCVQYANNNVSEDYSDDEYYKFMEEMGNLITREDLVSLMWKYCDYLLPKGPVAKKKFFDWIH